jgi:hypothetical protein
MSVQNDCVLHVVLLGRASDVLQADEICRISQGCPYVSAYHSSGSTVTGLFALPASKRWWIELPAQQPELMGLEKIELFFPQQAEYSSPWARSEVQPVLQEAPCGSHCNKCPQYQERCSGCPATIFYIP